MKEVIDGPRTLKEIGKRCKANQKELERLCRVEDDCIIFDVGDDYNIPFDRCNTPEKILEWVCHLCEKTWITTGLIHGFISLAAHHNKIKFHVGA